MTKRQRNALRDLKQRNKYRLCCEREIQRHLRRMQVKPSLSRVAAVSCVGCAAVFSGALLVIMLGS
jgi:hypothetical protein